MAFIYVIQWHRTLFAPAIRLYLCMSQDSICSVTGLYLCMSQDSICNDLQIQVLFSVMLEKYFKIAVQLIIISFTFLVLLKN